MEWRLRVTRWVFYCARSLWYTNTISFDEVTDSCFVLWQSLNIHGRLSAEVGDMEWRSIWLVRKWIQSRYAWPVLFRNLRRIVECAMGKQHLFAHVGAKYVALAVTKSLKIIVVSIFPGKFKSPSLILCLTSFLSTKGTIQFNSIHLNIYFHVAKCTYK